MKRVAFLLAVIAASLVFFSSCEKETVLSVDQQLLTFTDSGGSQILSLTANKPWTVSSDQSWCKVTPTAGEEAASSRISVNCDTNTTYDTRYCNITFTCAEIVKTVSVTQDESNGMLISPTEFDLSNEAQQVSIEVKANVKFTVAVDDACKNWIRHSATKGLTTSTVILDISKNEDYDGREGHVTISQTDGSLFSTIKIKQSQNNGLFITTPEYELSNESHQLSVEVKSNISFEVTSGASWIKYVETKSLNTSFIVLDIEANQDYDKREGKVIVKQKGGGLEGMITIKQDQNYGLLISKTEYDLSNVAQTIDVEIKHNVDFDVVIPADCKGWISKVNTKGLETNTMTFSIAKNDTYDNREGSITFKQKNGPLSGTVKVTQAQTDSIQVEKELYTIDHKGGNVEVNVKANVDYESTVEDAAKDWLSVVGTKAMDPSKITLSVTANESEQPREGKVYVKQPNGSAEASFIVKQAGKNTITATFHDFSASSVGDSFSVDVESTIEYDVVIPKDATWLTQVTTKAPATKTLSFQIATNKTAMSRVATIQFVNTKEGLSDTLRVEQNPVNVPVGNEILYTSTDGAVVSPYQVDAFNTKLISNSVIDGKGSIRFAETLLAIEEQAFYNRTTLLSVILPNGINKVARFAFDNCIRLKEASFPNTITYIDEGVFRNCRDLSSFNIPDKITAIPPNMFRGCTNLQTVVIPNNIQRIGGAAFRECVGLYSIDLPDSIIAIEDEALSYCSGLSEIKLPSKLTIINYASFEGCKGLKTLSVPEGITHIAWNAFADCENLVSVSLPSSLTRIDTQAFMGCKKLKTITLPEGLTEIGASIFLRCESLDYIDLPDGLSKISYQMFSGCKNLKHITIPHSITKIESSAFMECGFSSIQIPEEVVEMGWSVFSCCAKLESVKLPSKLISLGSSCFWSCVSLKSIEIPETLTRIEQSTFHSCKSLVSITIPQNVVFIGSAAFRACSGLNQIKVLPAAPPACEFSDVFEDTNNCPINVPKASVAAYKAAAIWKDYADRIQGF